jgi:hypothetical protein
MSYIHVKLPPRSWFEIGDAQTVKDLLRAGDANGAWKILTDNARLYAAIDDDRAAKAAARFQRAADDVISVA